MSTTDHRIPQNMDDWMRDIEKRLTRQERRLSSPAHAIITDENFPETAPTPWPDASSGSGELAPPTDPPESSPAVIVHPVASSLVIEATEDIDIQSSLEFEVATDDDFTTIVMSLSARQTSATLGPLPPNTDYWVRAVAFNAAGPAPPGPAAGPVQTLVYGIEDIEDLADTIDDINQKATDATTDHYDTVPPVSGTTPGEAGDTWSVVDGDKITEIWVATGTNTWAKRFIGELAVGALSVGKITGLSQALTDIHGDLDTIHVLDPSPVLVNNDPAAGSISWPTFDIKYGGQTFTVTGGDTFDRYVIFKWNGGSPTIVETADRPDELDPGDMILFSNNAGIGTRLFRTVLIDGDLLVDGTVVSRALATGAVTADKIGANEITADKLESVLALVTTLRVGGAVTISPPSDGDPGGILISLANGGEIRFPADGSDAVIRGAKLTATELTAVKVTINGDENDFAGRVTLGAGVLNPKLAPDVVASWDHPDSLIGLGTVQPDAGGQYGLSSVRGLWWDATNSVFLTVVHLYNDGWTTGVDTPAEVWVCSVHPTTGAVTKMFKVTRPSSSTWLWATSVCRIGTDYFVIGRKVNAQGEAAFTEDQNYVERYSVAGTKLGSTAIASPGGGMGFNYWTGLITTDGTNLWTLAYYTGVTGSEDVFRFARYTPSSTAGVACATTASVHASINNPIPNVVVQPRWMYVGSADFGGTRYMFGWNSSGQANTDKVVIGSGTPAAGGVTLTRQTAQEFTAKPHGEWMDGVAWDGTRFVGIETSGSDSLHRYSKFNSVTSRTFRNTYEDSVNLYTTEVSPPKSFSIPLRQWPKMAVTQTFNPAGTSPPDSYGYYVNGWKQGASTSPEFYPSDTLLTSGTPDPADNNFPMDDFGELVSQAVDVDEVPYILLTGRGSGRLGPIEWDEFGQPPAWVDFNAGAGDAPFAHSTYALCRYRKFGPVVQLQIHKVTNALRDMSANVSGDFANVEIVNSAAIPTEILPPSPTQVMGGARIADSPATVALLYDGRIIWTGGYPRSYASGVTAHLTFTYLV